ncbi:MAG TPA: hypothetical protein VHE35_24880 [Kofleriaceae bacterium]|nr:hypothetical protein [Kofleriaceae bacterium]
MAIYDDVPRRRIPSASRSITPPLGEPAVGAPAVPAPAVARDPSAPYFERHPIADDEPLARVPGASSPAIDPPTTPTMERVPIDRVPNAAIDRNVFGRGTRGPAAGRTPTAPPVGRGTLSGFDARLRASTGLRWPLGQRLGAGEAIELTAADTDLLTLARHPAQRSLRGELIHETLMIELGRALADCRPGLVPIRRLVYRCGTERLTYQATRAVGTLALVAVSPERHVLAAALNLIAPDLDLDGIGPRLLAGTILLPR